MDTDGHGWEIASILDWLLGLRICRAGFICGRFLFHPCESVSIRGFDSPKKSLGLLSARLLWDEHRNHGWTRMKTDGKSHPFSIGCSGCGFAAQDSFVGVSCSIRVNPCPSVVSILQNKEHRIIECEASLG